MTRDREVFYALAADLRVRGAKAQLDGDVVLFARCQRMADSYEQQGDALSGRRTSKSSGTWPAVRLVLLQGGKS